MYIFIVNPKAGNGRAKRVFYKIMKSHLYNEIDSTYYYTKYDGHAEEIAQCIRDNSKSITTIIVIGGDGTLHEVINGLANEDIPVSFIPGGSGNDFARGISIKEKTLDLFKRIIYEEKEMPYWLGNYRTDTKSNRFFVNSIGFGFDAEIARTANKSIHKNLLNILHIGTISYLIALIQVLLKFKPKEVEIEVNGEMRTLSKCWMVTITNHPFYGGGMKIIPNAVIQPTVFPVLLIHSISKWKVLALFMTVFTGKHINFKEVELIEATTLKIYSKEKLYYQVDGQTDMCNYCEITKQSPSIQIMRTIERNNTGAS